LYRQDIYQELVGQLWWRPKEETILSIFNELIDAA
jgi:hypothetical protein